MWNKVFERTPEVVSRSILEETLLVPVSGNLAAIQRIYSLSRVGAFIWEHLDGVRSLEEVRRAVAEKFDAPEEVIGADLLEYAGELEKAGLIAPRGA